MQRIAPGAGLQLPTLVYPTGYGVSSNNLSSIGNNLQSLGSGYAIVLPANDYLLDLGKYSSLQFLDPVSTTWRTIRTGGAGQGAFAFRADGYNYRIANLTGCVTGGVVTAGGSGYIQASTTVTTTGSSTWIALVGGRLANPTVGTAGSGYTLPPLVYIPAPPAPGVQATAVATLSVGTVSAITLINVGAGYLAAPPIVLLPNPADPNYGSIVPAAATTTLTGSGVVSAVLCTNYGGTYASAPALTINGVGTSATATANWLSTITAATIGTAGAGTATSALLTTLGGQPSGNAFTNPAIEQTGFVPRPAQIALTVSGGAVTAIGTIYDGGLSLGTPVGYITPAGGLFTTQPAVTFTLGGANDTVLIQPM